MRKGLKLLRVENDLSQEKMAEICGVCFSTYRQIENGTNAGKAEFWLNLQKAFDLTDSKTMELMKNENQKPRCAD